MTSRIGLFGGSFDPVHTAHMIVASVIREEFCLDSLYFIPNFVSPYKTGNITTDVSHRIEMLKLSTGDNEYFHVCEFEAAMNRSVYTYETVEYFAERFPDSDLFLIVGYDCYKTIGNWKNSDRIFKKAEIIVAERPDGNRTVDNPVKVKFSSYCPEMNISSSKIRELVSKNFNIKYLVNESVRCYIRDNGLYRPDINK
ncbi:MAG: nicotinate (nicotinamide) nucleotide adenylyltransferase [Candidatus Delongbacteria bacterium]|nr:nicotinate (nicotinamide) nucleotide adenylyltransferase [Candidatus Delongbacteria bacterium]